MNKIAAAVLAAAVGPYAPAQTRQHAETTIVVHPPAPPEMAFPLLGPVREAEWSPHWSPHMLYPADQAAGAVFTTRQHDVVWVLTTYHESALRIGYVVVWPGMCATKLDIALQATPDGTTEAAVTYRRTALSEAGDTYVKDFARDFPGQREHWEQAIGSPLRELRKR